jgi:hypothetical protein
VTSTVALADPEHVRLIELLDDLLRVLDEEGGAWSTRVRESRQLLIDGNARGVDHLISMFGGAGSFDDGASNRSLAAASEARELATRIRDRRTVWQQLRLMRRTEAASVSGLVLATVLVVLGMLWPVFSALRDL